MRTSVIFYDLFLFYDANIVALKRNKDVKLEFEAGMKTEDRYTRNILIENIGQEGQEKLKTAKVLVIGAGGLGSPVLFYLAAAGVGTLGIVDDDTVNISNLQRQILHRTNDIGSDKILSAGEKLSDLNPEVKIVVYNERFTEENAAGLIEGRVAGRFINHASSVISRPERGEDHIKDLPSGSAGEYDFVVDCCDNYKTKILINDICVAMGKPYSHGAVVAMHGEVMTYVPGAACYRCVFDIPPEDGKLPTSSEIGILGAVAGIVGCIQATETLKYLVGMNDLITNRILIIDAKTMNFVSLKVKINDKCRCR